MIVMLKSSRKSLSVGSAPIWLVACLSCVVFSELWLSVSFVTASFHKVVLQYDFNYFYCFYFDGDNIMCMYYY